jgi:hypothetical protein
MKFNDIKKMILQIIEAVTRTYKDNLPAWLVSICAFLIGALGNVGLTMLLMVILTFVDMLFGVSASLKQNQGIKSSKLRDTPLKIFGYVSIVLVLFLFDTVIDTITGLQTKYLALISCSIFAGVEVWSIIGNAAICFPKLGGISLIQKLFSAEMSKKLGITEDEVKNLLKENKEKNETDTKKDSI